MGKVVKVVVKACAYIQVVKNVVAGSEIQYCRKVSAEVFIVCNIIILCNVAFYVVNIVLNTAQSLVLKRKVEFWNNWWLCVDSKNHALAVSNSIIRNFVAFVDCLES